MKAQFILDAIVEQDDIDVSQEEFVEYLIMQAQQYGMDPNQFAQAIDSNNQVPGMLGEVARRKALAGVLDRAVITDTSGAVVDLSELAPDDDSDENDDDADLDDDAPRQDVMEAELDTPDETPEGSSQA